MGAHGGSPDEAARRPDGGGLLNGYAPLPGVPDELVGPDGALRPAWAPLIAHLAAMEPEDLAARRGRADRYLRDAGVFYRHYDGATSAARAWPLSHMPVLIDEAEWAEVTAGLMERADLLEAVCADLYGPNRLVADGHLPADLLAHGREWLRPMVGVTPRSGHFLQFVAFDIGRRPDGQWWVIGDRSQAPSGAGFALENRIATARAYPELYARTHVHRLAGFFRSFRDRLLDLRGGDDSRVGILTPGPHNDTYFEHAYIARYLGFPLLEGEDLKVRDGAVMVRTVSGLRPVSVLWRRLDSAWADPLELDESSHIGTPGLVGAVRAGSVTMVNAIGSGVLETRALLAFLPRISEVLTGKRLAIPNIATWWCGGARERAYVAANAARMTVGDAFATRALTDAGDASGGDDLVARLAADGPRLVAQEAVTLSTTPAFVDGRLAPRPMSLRVFLARTRDGWSVMPGGYARIGRDAGSAELALQRGGSAADVWVVARSAVPAETLLGRDTGDLRLQPGVLPSRAGDNLFWLGRYVERAELTARLLRAWHRRLAEEGAEEAGLLARIATHLDSRDADPVQGLEAAVAPILAAALVAAGHVRDRFSVDGWIALDDLAASLPGLAEEATPGDGGVRATGTLLRGLSGFSGLVHENMYRFSGWRFLSIGRDLERALAMARLLADFADRTAPDGSLDLAVEVGDSTLSHRRRYAAAPERATVVDLLALDPLNPRAILYQLNEIAEHLSYLPGNERYRQLSPLQRRMTRCQAAVATAAPDDLTTPWLLTLAEELSELSDLVAEAYLR